MPTQFLLGMVVAWLLTGVVTAYVMRRRGHDLFLLFTLGSVLGPLVVPLAIERARSDRAIDARRPRAPALGKLDILVGIDGSEESLDALSVSKAMLGESATSFTLASVLDYDAATSPAGAEERERTQERLDALASDIDNAGTEILYGRPGKTLRDYAEANGIELIVVGARGHGGSKALFGSVTQSLVGGGNVPVLVGRKPIKASRPYMAPD